MLYPVGAALLALLALTATSLLLALFGPLRFRGRRKLMPPGPKGVPVLGNLLQVPQKAAFRKFTEWADTYGPMFSLNMAGKPVVVLNTLKVADELLNRRSSIYSSRPCAIVGEMITAGKSVVTAPYGPLWRSFRRSMHESMNNQAFETYRPIQERQSLDLLGSLLNEPEGWKQHVERSVATAVISIAYGTALAEKNIDSILERIWNMLHLFFRLARVEVPMVEFLPILRYTPSWLAKWKREAQSTRREYDGLFEGWLDEVRKTMDQESSQISLSGRMLQAQKNSGLSSSEISWLAGWGVLSAGMETSSGQLQVFIFAIVRHPDVMRRAQEELDRVVGRERLPTLDDQDRLVYIDAVIKEVLRWWPVAPLGFPRETIQDDWYGGYLIPKGTTIIANLWAMGRDAEEFRDPELFRPERFLVGEGQDEIKPRKPFAFSFGRRICPGINIGLRLLYLNISRLLWAFEFHPVQDEAGNPVFPCETEVEDDGATVRPKSFVCSIRPRFTDVPDMVLDALESYKDTT